MVNTSLPRSTPESQGVDPGAIADLIERIQDEGLPLHSLMIVRHGHVVSETWWAPYSAPQPHMVFSVSKSFTAAAIGIAQDEGRLSVDDEVLSFFPSYANDLVRANMAGVRVRDLLAMASGQVVDTIDIMASQPDQDWVRIFLDVPRVFPPGAFFLYNSGASHVLAAIVTARTGQSVLDYLEPRLFEPLGIETPHWELAPSGIVLGGSGMRVVTEDLAKLGQLYVQRGEWDGRRILSEEWVDAASTAQVANDGRTVDWNQGYCFQFWRSRHNSYRADGAFGQFSLILPEHDLVVAITEGTDFAQKTLDAVWDTLLPGLSEGAVEASPEASARLAAATAGIETATPEFQDADAAFESSISGRTIPLPFNTLQIESLTLRFDADAVHLDVARAGEDTETVTGGRNGWHAGTSTVWWRRPELELATTGTKAGWTSARRLEIHEQIVDTPFRRIWVLEFGDGGAVTVQIGLAPEYWGANNMVLPASLS
jgi:CubicO group peptidase (beta-lactamase class C family)